MKTIQLLEEMTSPITHGCKLIPSGTIMTLDSTCCSWYYFKGDGHTLLIMGHGGEDWRKVKELN